jgi:hypothetical protein
MLLIAVVSLASAAPAAAATIRIGDIDGFGFSPTIGLFAASGAVADTDNDGVLTAGEYLPDLNRNGSVADGSGDAFDNRSAAEIASLDGAQWTDRSLAPVGTAHNATFTFTFAAPAPGDVDFGVDRAFHIVFGDYDVFPAAIDLDGIVVPLVLQGGGQDGLIQLATADVPFALLIDGQLIARIIAPTEPYLAVDYAELVGADVAPVPEPASMGLMLLGAAGLLLNGRGRWY